MECSTVDLGFNIIEGIEEDENGANAEIVCIRISDDDGGFFNGVYFFKISFCRKKPVCQTVGCIAIENGERVRVEDTPFVHAAGREIYPKGKYHSEVNDNTGTTHLGARASADFELEKDSCLG